MEIHRRTTALQRATDERKAIKIISLANSIIPSYPNNNFLIKFWKIYIYILVCQYQNMVLFEFGSQSL